MSRRDALLVGAGAFFTLVVVLLGNSLRDPVSTETRVRPSDSALEDPHSSTLLAAGHRTILPSAKPQLSLKPSVSPIPSPSTHLSMDPKDILEKKPTVAKRKLIFSLNSGMTGSKFLSLVLDKSPNVTCYHERRPSLMGFRFVMHKGLNETFQSRREEKIPALYKDFTSEPEFLQDPNRAYCDTSHMFFKSWMDVVMDEFGDDHEIHVVVLRRWLVRAVRSALGVGKRAWSPKKRLNAWVGGEYSLYHRGFAILPPMRGDITEEDTVDLAIGYFLDTEAQFARLKLEYPQVHYHEYRLEALAKKEVMDSLFEALGVDPPPGKWNVNPLNGHADPKLRAVPDEAYLYRILAHLEERRAKNLPLPPYLSHLYELDPENPLLAVGAEPIGVAQLQEMKTAYMPYFDNMTTIDHVLKTPSKR